MGLAVDLAEDRLYWVDPEKGTIESISYSSRDLDRRTVKSGESDSTYLAITVYEVSEEPDRVCLAITAYELSGE